MTLLEVKNVVSGYGSVEVLHGVSINVEKGKIVGIIGPNGSGKSTLLKTIIGVVRVRKGRIILNGEDVTNFTPKMFLQRGVAYVPQGRSIFPYLTVRENLEMGVFTLKIDKYELVKRLKEVYDIFPVLKEKENDIAGSLSGGQQMMLCIGRALMSHPEILFLDEPSLGLAPRFVDKIYKTLREIRKTYLIVEQNVRKILDVADYIYVLDLGRKRFEGESEKFLKNKQLRKLYLGSE